MHEGWWVAVLVVVVMLALGGAVHYSAHSGDVVEPPPADIEPEIDIEELLTDYEVMLVPTDTLGIAPGPVLDAVRCARLCTVVGENDDARGGDCGPPLRIAGSLEQGARLVVGIPRESVRAASPFLAARDKRLLIVAADACALPDADPEPAEEAEPEEAS